MELFSLKNEYALDNPIHKNDFIKYSPSSLATINNTNSNVSFNFPREYAYNCLQNSYIYHLNLKFLRTTTHDT